MGTLPTGAERFGRWLDLTMGNKDIKGRDLAKRLKVHDSAVSRWRSGQGVPTMDTTLKLAKLLRVDPLRLAVTAGLMDGNIVDVEPLPTPEPTAQRAAVKRQLSKIRGLTEAERERLMDTYDDMTGGDAS
ncbi:helix-turn-helix domain-containing protein [Streptomyces sp. NPDC002666]